MYAAASSGEDRWYGTTLLLLPLGGGACIIEPCMFMLLFGERITESSLRVVFLSSLYTIRFVHSSPVNVYSTTRIRVVFNPV